MVVIVTKQSLDIRDDYEKKYGFKTNVKSVYETEKGLSERVVREISDIKKESDWLKQFRLRALNHFLKRPLPQWGGNLNAIDLNDIVYYVRPTDQPQAKTWEDLPPEIKKTFDALGIPEAERKFLAGVGAQFESENVYHSLQKHLEKQGVIFVDPDTGLREYPHIFKKYFSTVIPIEDNKFAALNSAVFSGGSFIYVPPGVHVEMPLQAYFRINRESMGQFERTLIIADEGSKVHYIEGCTAAMYANDKSSLHTAVVELVALKGAQLRYTTLQNWPNNVYNLVTKRAIAHEGATVEWLDANIGCLEEGTKIFGNPSVKKIEDISVGEKVFAYDETTKEIVPKKVTGVKFSGVKKTFRVVLGDGKREIVATNNHPFLKLQYDRQKPRKMGRYWFEWTNLENIKVGDHLLVPTEFPDTGIPHNFIKPNLRRKAIVRNQYGAEYEVNTKYKYNKIVFPKFTKEEIMWLLGVYVGDGSVDVAKSKKSNANRYGRVTFSVPTKDPIRKRVENTVKKIFSLKKSTKRADGVCVTYNSLLFAEWIKTNGFGGNTHTKRLPKWIYSLPKSQKLAFIAGYCEADARIHNRSIRLKACNRKLVEDIRLLALSCNMYVNKVQEHIERKSIKIGKQNTPEKEYRNYVTFISKLDEISNHLTEDNKNKIRKRKLNQPRFIHVTRTRRIESLPLHLGILPVTSIKDSGIKSTYDLEIEGAHNFVANGILVHNSRLTMKYPSVYMVGPNAKADILSVAFAGKGQHQDTGGKAIHLAPNTTSRIISKSVSKDSGRTTYRGLLHISKGATNAKSTVRCDALLVDDTSRTDTYPYNEIQEDTATVTHEAAVGKIGEDLIFYLMSRGLNEQEALGLVVNGFFDIFTKELPMEYAIEFNRLIQLEMSGSVG